MSRIKWKLTATYLTVIFVSMTVVGLYVSYSMEKLTVAQLHERLVSHLGLATEIISGYLTAHPEPYLLDSLCDDVAQKVNARVVVRDTHGGLMGDSARTEPDLNLQPPEEKKLSERPCQICHAEARGKPQQIAESANIIVGGRKVGTVEISASEFGAKHTSGKTRRIIMSGLILAMLIAAGVSQRLAGNIATPISKMNKMAKEIAEGNLDQQVSIDSNDEVGEFAHSFNQMAQRLHEMMDTIADEKEKMATILATMADGIIVTDEHGTVGLFNKAAERMFLVKAKGIVGKSIEQAGLPADVATMVREALAAGEFVRKQIRVSDEPEVTLSAHCTRVRDASGRKRGTVVALRDMTERLHHEKAQRDFVGNVSHELRTPITAVRVTAEALRSGAKDNPELLEKFLDNLVHESERLSLLIDDLLEIAKLDAGRRKPKQGHSSILEAVGRAVGRVKARAEMGKLAIDVEVPMGLTGDIDEQQIEQVLTNLLDNAVKYTPSGGTITVTANEQGDWIAVRVADTGMGIPKEDLRRIFERFYRVDKARSRELGGTGLGLAIVRDIVTEQGGTVTVRSELDKGSVFTITVPKWDGNGSNEAEA